ncbi:hypothetical protein OG352_06250 [Streptomyces sp. NBC_01485]|uniref:hypothetical protein n=1 Tax=Streptomyces sp. NBC_01485 TaxID=2903884 RepID=UPI002E33FD21|nr:hypothetical protein [Streptomyces sp. NBC_01485]
MRAEPGPDERRVRHLLDRLGARPIGHPAPQGSLMTDTPAHRKGAPRMPDWWRTHTTATPPAADPAPEPEPDWWDALYADTDSDSDSFGQDPADRHPDSRWAPQPDYWPRPHIPAALTPNPDHVAAAISPKTRAALYNASAAGAGWALGLYGPLAHAIADCGTYSTGGALTLGLGGCLLIAHVWDRRTRHWWPGIAWVARIPLATAVLALALWAPAA